MQPVSGPVPVTIGLGRANRAVTVCLLIFLVAVVGAGISGGARSEGSSRLLGFGIAALFAIPLVMLVFALPRFFAQRNLVQNPAGVGIQHGRLTVQIAWPDIVAYGIGYAVAQPQPAKVPTSLEQAQDMLKERLADAAMQALQVAGPVQLYLEIYPVAPQLVDRYPKLRPYVKPQPQPVNPGLPPVRWRLSLPPSIPLGEHVARALYAWSPQRWAGYLSRPWDTSGK
jgi:hypothetical protein